MTAKPRKPLITAEALVPTQERLPTSADGARYTGENLPDETRKAVILDLRSGTGIKTIATKYGISDHVVTALRRQDDEDHGVDLSAWKRHTAATLARFVATGTQRLVDEVDKIPVGQLPIPIAVAIDKIAHLTDSPQTITEHRLTISHEAINRAILDADIVSVNEIKPIEDASN